MHGYNSILSYYTIVNGGEIQCITDAWIAKVGRNFLYHCLAASLSVYNFLCEYILHYRRKFRNQTSDNMGRWKAEMGRGREKRRVEESRSEKRTSQKKEDAEEPKGSVFQCLVAPEGRQVSSLQRRARSQLPRWEIRPHRRCWGVIVRMALVKGYRFTWGGGAFFGQNLLFLIGRDARLQKTL